MKRLFIFAVLICLGNVSNWAMAQDLNNAELGRARTARDRADVSLLQKVAAKAKQKADRTNNAQAYVRLALIQSWLCEAIESSGNTSLFKKAAEDGVKAAEKAVGLDPKSSAAHQLLGDLLNQLIPHVFGGGMRYGKRATDAMDKAIELDPRNTDAYVSRAIAYYYTPDSFGGGKTKALDMLKKAVEIDPDADTPHIWLAMFHLDAKQNQEALAEILRARTINPNRAFTKYVYSQVVGAANDPKRTK